MKIVIETDNPHLIMSTLWKAGSRYRNQAVEMRSDGVDGVAEQLEVAAQELERAAASIASHNETKLDFQTGA